MKILFQILLLILSFKTSHADTSSCFDNVQAIQKEYAQLGIIIDSYQVKSCSSLIHKLDIHKPANAPKVQMTNACIILAKTLNSEFRELIVFDPINNFSLKRSFDNQENEIIGISRFGTHEDGTIQVVKSVGTNGKNELGNLKKTKFITRVEYNFTTDEMLLLRWKLGWFGNKYSHFYSVSCR